MITRGDISQLWEDLTQAFGHKFLSNFGDRDNGVWFEALKNLTKVEVSQGFDNLLKTITPEEREKKQAWPPNVKEFYLYCLDAFKDQGVPSIQEAYHQCQQNLSLKMHNWHHPAIFYAMLCFGPTAIKDDFWCKKITLFKTSYLLMSQLFLEGKLPLIPATKACCQALIVQHANGMMEQKFLN